MDYRHTGEININKIPAVMDDEYSSDNLSIRVCPDCGTANVSVDMMTNALFCNTCKKEFDVNKKFNFQKFAEDQRNKELELIQLSMRKGNKITVNE